MQQSKRAHGYMEGNFAPVPEEITIRGLEVLGELPLSLTGCLLRNGPNPHGSVDLTQHHWFEGDGMVHGVRLEGGRAVWYRNRWVRGEQISRSLGEPALAGAAPNGPGSPNTNTFILGGKAYALVESGGLPVELDAELRSVTRSDFAGTLSHGFAAHPKRDPRTGDVHAMCYDWAHLRDHIQYVVVGPDGRVKHTADIPLASGSMVHDIAITETHVLIYDFPVTLDIELAMQGDGMPFRWNPESPSRVGVMPMYGLAEQIRWCEARPGYVFHTLNAFDAGDDRIVVDPCRYDRVADKDHYGPFEALPLLERWTLDPDAGTVREEQVFDRPVEFPRVAPSFIGQRHRCGYTVRLGPGGLPGSLCKHDLQTGRTEVHAGTQGLCMSEPSFVPRPGHTAEDDGWLLAFGYDPRSRASQLLVLDAQDFARPVIARVMIGARIPFGFHGDWIDDAALF